MASCAFASPWAPAASPARSRRCRTLLQAARSQYGLKSTSEAAEDESKRLQTLPRITFSYDRTQMNADEVAGMLARVACFAPGQSFHREDASSSQGSSNSQGSSDASSVYAPSSSSTRPKQIDPARLHGAMQRSLVCVAAYTEARHLPSRQHLASRGLQPSQRQAAQAPQDVQQQQQQQQQQGGGPALRPSQRQPQRTRRVLVGFARAVGDASLVATVHDVAVAPELQGLGLGRQLVERLTRQLDMLGIIDIGLLAPDSSRGFFSACSFGRDTENSTVMTLAREGVDSRAGLPLEGMAVHIKLPTPHQAGQA